jgi:CheY-like chemotaxis protein
MHKHTILYAEDDPDDVFVVRQAFQEYDGSVNLQHAPDGFETIEILKDAANRKSLPCLIILDINMPGMDGKETLIRIKQSPHFQNIPVVLFTTSSSEVDKSFARKWGAEFITKPLVFSELQELARTFLNLCNSVPAKTS